jgi:hypothetical protein
MRLIRLALLCMCVGMPTILHGGIVERDFRVLGDGLLTYDDVSHREWLDLTETLDWNLPTLEAALSIGGSLCGFKSATLADLEELATSVGIPWITPWQFPTFTGKEANLLIELVGSLPTDVDDGPSQVPERFTPDFDDTIYLPPAPFGPTEVSVGFIADASGLIAQTTVVVVGEELRPGQMNVPISFKSWGGIFVHEFELDSVAGPYWLYRAVPEPNSLSLFLMFAAVRALTRRAAS